MSISEKLLDSNVTRLSGSLSLHCR